MILETSHIDEKVIICWVILKQVLPKAKLFDLENEQDFNLVENDPGIIFKDYKRPIIFDEAQLSKNLFKALRAEIDKTRKNGQFLLSGSSSPELLSNISETLAGRIAIVEIPCFNFSESHSKEMSNLLEVISVENFIKENNCLLGMVINRGDEVKFIADKILQVPVNFI